MQRFPVLEELYAPFINALRVGNLPAYDRALDKWERRLLELNLWLTLEKARELCLRGLFRKVLVYMILRSLDRVCQLTGALLDGWLCRKGPGYRSLHFICRCEYRVSR